MEVTSLPDFSVNTAWFSMESFDLLSLWECVWSLPQEWGVAEGRAGDVLIRVKAHPSAWCDSKIVLGKVLGASAGNQK